MQSLRCAVIRSQPLFRLRSGASSSFGGIAFQKYSPLARYSSKSDGPHDPYHFEVNKPEDVKRLK